MSARAEPSAAVAAPETPPGRKILFVGPMITLITAGITKSINWDIGLQGYVLLGVFAALGVGLECIPQKVRAWDVRPLTSEAALKQAVGTLRTFVAVVLVLFPIGILATNNKWLEKVPDSFNAYVVKQTGGNTQVVYLTNAPPESKNIIFVGRLDGVASPAPGGGAIVPVSNSATPAAPAAAEPKGKLYIVDTNQLLIGIAKQVVLPVFYSAAFAAWIVSALFVFAIFIIEHLGNMVWEHRRRLEIV